MKRIVLAPLVLVACAALTGCDGVTATPVKPADTPSVSLTDIAGPTIAPTQPSVEALPASWTLCQNQIIGSSMGYPSDWHTASLGPSDACGLFDPDPFTIVPNSDVLRVALYAHQSQSTAEQVLGYFTNSEQFATILSEPTTADGRPAYRFEVVSLGAPLIDPGTRFYGYIIDRGGKVFTLHTQAMAGEPRYTNWKLVVDTAKGTLTFDH